MQMMKRSSFRRVCFFYIITCIENKPAEQCSLSTAFNTNEPFPLFYTFFGEKNDITAYDYSFFVSLINGSHQTAFCF